MIQLYMAGLIGVAFILQYGVMVLALLFKKRLDQIPGGEYEDLGRKDSQMMVVRVMNINPLGINVPYPWLVYASTLSALLCLLAFSLMAIKMFYKSGPGGDMASYHKTLVQLEKRVASMKTSLENEKGLLNFDVKDYADQDDVGEKIETMLSSIIKLSDDIEDEKNKVNDESTPSEASPPLNSNLAISVGEVETKARELVRDVKDKYNKAKRAAKERERKEGKGGLLGGLLGKKKEEGENDGEATTADKGGLFGNMFNNLKSSPKNDAESKGESKNDAPVDENEIDVDIDGSDEADAPAKDGEADAPAKDGEADAPANDGEADAPAKDGEADAPAKDGPAKRPDFKKYITQIEDLLRQKRGGGFFSRKTEPKLPEDPIAAANAIWQNLKNDKRFNLNDNMSMTRFVNAFSIHLRNLGEKLENNYKSSADATNFVNLQNAVADINNEMTDYMNIEISQRGMEVNGGGNIPAGGNFTPNYTFLAPIAAAGLIMTCTGLYTFISFVMKVQEIGSMSNDATYEGIIKENIPRSPEFLEALKEFALGSTKVNPYTWPPRTINMSFDPDNESDVDEIVKMMFMYRLASHFVKNIAMLETESKSYAAQSLTKRASQAGAMAEDIGSFFGMMATEYVTDMAPLKRFKGDVAYDDVGAMTELLRCPDDKCPVGEVTFADMYRNKSDEITRKLDEISFRLATIVDSSSYTQRLVTQYKIASEYIDTFMTMNVYVPLGMLLLLVVYVAMYIENRKTRKLAICMLFVFMVVPYIIRYFVDW